LQQGGFARGRVQFEQAEEVIDRSLRMFSLFAATRILALHHLAMLRHAQRRWAESAALCRAVLAQRLGRVRGLSKSARLMLADSLLEINDLAGAHAALAGLYSERLALGEAINLLVVQFDYLWRVGAWAQMMAQPSTTVQLAELMPTKQSARTQALLALAARKTGREEWAQWLRRRVELLVDVRELAAERPVLWELWTQ
jgi:methylmalonyl-CoA mutase N-terminal domain/subunit